jgi:vesicle transport through interaction with t-SNAREs 1
LIRQDNQFVCFKETNDPERRKVLQIHSSLMNAGESLARSTQIAIETEQIGNSVLTELNSQGEQLRRTTERLDDTSVALSKSRKLLNKLSNGVFYNKFLIVVIIILELISLAGVIYWKFIAKK